jgi:transposase
VPGKKGPEEPQDHALGRSRGGLTAKIHMLCDANGVPLKFLLSGGQASDIAYAQPLLDEAYIPSLRGRPRKRCRWLLANKGYDAEALRRYYDRYRMQPVIPLRSMKRKPKPGLPRLFDRPKYRQRNIIERNVWLVEGKPPHRDTLRQTRKKLRGDGFAGLCYAVFTTLLFVQSLSPPAEPDNAKLSLALSLDRAGIGHLIHPSLPLASSGVLTA